ncbi:hypothetical protein EZV62_003773 [Acer yangbiense]|uniref:ABC-2 type transporter transmembrane domain-containing protein n=1 Tax=Acer yangbiense TaxID=1000413 RepID=A0A5C7II89_9ROSI|nr:hypothetical protein EZV62_003773 [Acer yangbiense]
MKVIEMALQTSGNATKLALGKPQAIILEDRKKMSNPTGEEKRARQKEKESERSWRDRGQSLEVIIHVSVSTKREDSTDLIRRNQQLLDSTANCRNKTTVLYQERVAGMYSALPYALAQVIVEIPYIFDQTIYYSLIAYAMVSFKWDDDCFKITPNHQAAAIFASAFYALFTLFSSFFIPKPRTSKW